MPAPASPCPPIDDHADGLGGVDPQSEHGIGTAEARSRQDRWIAENQAAIESSNAFVEQHGLPLAQYRTLYAATSVGTVGTEATGPSL